MFRYFQLKAGRVELGAPLPSTVTELGIPGDEPGSLVLPSTAIRGAERITLVLASTGELSAATFEYGPDVDFETRVTDYRALGDPARRATPDSGEEARWEDDATAFTLRRVPNGGGSRVTAELRDRR